MSKTEGSGTPVTLGAADPEITNIKTGGSSMCYTTREACQRAVDKYEDDKVYSDYTAYIEKIKGGALSKLSLGDFGCIAIFECKNSDYHLGFKGIQLKEVYIFPA